MKYESIHFNHEVTYFVPCFIKIPEEGYPTFEYRMEQATSDEQMAWSLLPDYVLTLKGRFDAKTQPYDSSIRDYNRGLK